MKNKLVLLIMLVLLLSNLVLLYLYFGKTSKGHRKNRIVERMVKEVGFNKEQASKLEALTLLQKKSLQPLMDSMRQVKKDYIEALITGTNKEQIKEQHLYKLCTQMLNFDTALYSKLMEARKICTPAQYPLYDDMVKKILMRMPEDKKQ